VALRSDWLERAPKLLISPLVGEMPGRAEGALSRQPGASEQVRSQGWRQPLHCRLHPGRL